MPLIIVAAVVAGVLAVAVMPGDRARACSCAEFTLESALAGGAAAFVGTPEAEVEDAPAGRLPEGPSGWRFDVEAVVRGELPDRVEVWPAGGGDCGPTFTVGQRVGVVLRRDGDRYVTDACGGVWLPDELLHPGALAAPTGQGSVSLIAAGRSGPAVLAAYDADGNLAAWGLGEPEDELSHLRVCPGSTTFVGIAVRDEPRLVRRDVATLAPLGTVPLPERAQDSWPMITDPRALHCVSPDGDVMALVSASGFGDGGTDNVVVWIDGDTAHLHRLDHGWGLAPASDGQSAILLAGADGTDVERLVLADGTRHLITRLPDGLGGRSVAVDPDTGRLAIIATTNPTLHARGDPAASVNRLVVLDADGTLQRVAELSEPRLADSVEWLDPQHVRVVWSLPTIAVETIGLDGSVQSARPVDTTGPVVVDGRVYAATSDGVSEIGPDGQQRLLTPGIARVGALVAVPAGPIAAPQPTPTIPAASPTTTPTIVDRTTVTTPAQSGTTTASPAGDVTDDPTDRDPSTTVAAAIVGLVLAGGTITIIWWRRKHTATA
jgi:outer membrane protein assembly factor BamB